MKKSKTTINHCIRHKTAVSVDSERMTMPDAGKVLKVTSKSANVMLVNRILPGNQII
jgi:hypothetical protein